MSKKLIKPSKSSAVIKKAKTVKLADAIKAAVSIFVLFVSAMFIKICADNLRADIAYQDSQDFVAEMDFPTALDYANQAIKLNPLEPNYYRMRARVFISYLPSKELAVQKVLKPVILKDLAFAYDLNPNNLVTIRNIIPLYYFVAAQNILVGADPQNVDAVYMPFARDFYAKVKNISPNDVGVYALEAKYERRLGLTEQYNLSIQKVRELRPDLLDWFEAFK